MRLDLGAAIRLEEQVENGFAGATSFEFLQRLYIAENYSIEATVGASDRQTVTTIPIRLRALLRVTTHHVYFGFKNICAILNGR